MTPPTKPPAARPGLFLLPVLSLCLAGGWLVMSALPSGAAAAVSGSIAAVALFPMSACLATMCLGVAARCVRQAPADAVPPPSGDMAILVPCHDEDIGEVLVRIGAMRRSLAASAPAGTFPGPGYAFHLASDTQDAALAAAERETFARWQGAEDARAAVPGSTPLAEVHYRRRPSNSGRKVGNVASWFDEHGDRYPFVALLDADSTVGAAWLLHAHATVSADPGLALFQSMLAAAGRGSAHARLAQFCSRLCGPLWADGSAAWMGDNANYWGHNAVVRTAAFREAARLPTFGDGSTFLSHDIVEAALLAAAGWKVRLDPAAESSWEETPVEAATSGSRERRWCEGNLQHLRMIGRRDLTLSSRLHMASGLLHYAAAPAALLAVAAAAVAVRFGHGSPPPAGAGWPAAALVALVALPVAMGCIDAAVRRRSAGFGGAANMVAGAAASAALALARLPGSLVAETTMLVSVVTGRSAGWNPQARCGADYTLAAALRGNAVPSAAAGMACLALGCGTTASALVAAMSLAAAALSVPMGVPAPAIVPRARLWDTVDNLAPAEPLRSYLLERDGNPPQHGPAASPARGHLLEAAAGD